MKENNFLRRREINVIANKRLVNKQTLDFIFKIKVLNICDNGHCVDSRMIDLARKLDKADREALSRAAMHLTKMEQYPFAAEVYSKMGDIRALINLHVEAKHWEDVRL